MEETRVNGVVLDEDAENIKDRSNNENLREERKQRAQFFLEFD